ncbi:MAG: transglutaminase, partial [Planctomycetota bacterium]
ERLQYKIYSERPWPEGDQPYPRGTHSNSIYAGEIDYYRALPRGLERLQELAKQVGSPADAPNSTPTDMARRIVHYLRDSGEFGYTLDMSVNDPKIDAVEDFLFNRKQGHCEYFASALGLMLRAVNIPARLVSGFKGGDQNASTGYFVVQGRHAHVWVEALLNGRWRVLDATPASRSDSVKSLAPKSNLIRALADFCSDVWSHHIVGMSFNEQNSNVYMPLKELGAGAWEDLQSSFESFVILESTADGAARQRLQFVLGGVAVLLAVMTGLLLLASRSNARNGNRPRWLASLLRFMTWLLPAENSMNNGDGLRSRWSRWWSALLRRLRGESDEQRLRVEFYERFLRLARSTGLEPLPAQTAREFVVATQPTWSDRLADGNGASIPAVVVTQFYRVRFGGELLSPDELQQLDAQLSQMEQHCRDRNGRR